MALMKMTFGPYHDRWRQLVRAEPPDSHNVHSAATLLREPQVLSGLGDSTRFSNLCQLIILEARAAIGASFQGRILALF